MISLESVSQYFLFNNKSGHNIPLRSSNLLSNYPQVCGELSFSQFRGDVLLACRVPQTFLASFYRISGENQWLPKFFTMVY